VEAAVRVNGEGKNRGAGGGWSKKSTVNPATKKPVETEVNRWGGGDNNVQIGLGGAPPTHLQSPIKRNKPKTRGTRNYVTAKVGVHLPNKTKGGGKAQF